MTKSTANCCKHEKKPCIYTAELQYLEHSNLKYNGYVTYCLTILPSISRILRNLTVFNNKV